MSRIVAALALIASACPGLAGQRPTVNDLAHASLEDLMSVEVTSASKKPQKLSRTPAAVYVITQEDIRRSGLRTVPELLRLAAGVEVARIDDDTWAITIRGFNEQFSNKLLVMVDGRSVYSDLFSGVFWDAVDSMIENIDRIEVIRGPGGAIWGTNAVNGVINIITKDSRDTQGGLVLGEGGTNGYAGVATRYGIGGANASLRVSGRLQQRDVVRETVPGIDSARRAVFGFRADWEITPRDTLLFESDAFRGSTGLTVFSAGANGLPIPAASKEHSRGDSIVGKWTRRTDPGSEFSLQGYYQKHDLAHPTLPLSTWMGGLDLVDRFHLGERQEIVVGGSYRRSSYTAQPTFLGRLVPPSVASDLASGFVQHDIGILGDRLHLVSGIRVDHLSNTGYSAQPTIRLIWEPEEHVQTWFSVSRGVRTPSWVELAIQSVYQAPTPGGVQVFSLTGKRGFVPETMVAYEVGQRVGVGKHWSADLAAFYNDYDNLQSLDLRPVIPAIATFGAPFEVFFSNSRAGHSYGGEAVGNWAPAERLRLSSGFTWFRMAIQPKPGHLLIEPTYDTGLDPRIQWQAHCYWDITHSVQLDTAIYFTGYLPEAAISQHTRADVRVSWRPKSWLELSASGQDLFRPEHVEFNSNVMPGPHQVRRTVYGRVQWAF